MAQETIQSAEIKPERSKRAKDVSADKRAELQKQLQKKAEEDSKMVRGFFRFHEVPGGTLRFPYRAYRNEAVKTYELEDGKLYTVPLGVAKHLNNNCWYPVHATRQNEDGTRSKYIGKKVKRCSFQSTDYVDIEAGTQDYLVEPVKIIG